MLTTLLQDVYSDNKEHGCGHAANNMITVIKEERGIGLQEVFDVAGRFFENDVDEFLRCKELLPSWGPDVDEAVSREPRVEPQQSQVFWRPGRGSEEDEASGSHRKRRSGVV